jgi:uncharacterized protein YciI
MSKTYLVIYDQTGDAETRERLRPDHIAYRRGLGDGLHMAGPLLDDLETAVGSVIIIRAADTADATAAASADPYVKAGVLKLRSVTPMRIAKMVAPSTP